MANTKERTKNAKLNWISSIVLQIVTAVSGLILPRLIIPVYGSSVNGVISSISQFISYMTLLEAGVGSVFRASLYKPLYQGDMEKVSGVINEQKRFYRKLGRIFVIYIVALCAFFPMLVKTKYDHIYIALLVLILSVGTFIEYFISLPYQSLIIADQMVRLPHVASSLVIICNIISTVILVKIGASIVVIKAVSALIAVMKPAIYVWYVKTHYQLNPSAKPDSSALSQRWNGMVHHFSFYIHRNTDVLLLSVLVGTKTVSIYGVYLAIVSGIEKIITSISGSLSAGIGNLLASGDKKLIDKTMDTFEMIQTTVTTTLFTIAALMLMPFIRLYTASMTDANYIQPLFGYILIAAEAIYCFRCIYSSITFNGNKFKETQLGAILEAVINLALSTTLILLFDTESKKLIGIAVGTFFGMLARLICEVFYLRRGLIYRPAIKALKTMVLCGISSVFSILICNLLIDYHCETIVNWIIKGVQTTVIVSGISLIKCYLFHHASLMDTIGKLHR